MRCVYNGVMLKKMIIYRSDSLLPYFNLAAEEYLTKNTDHDVLTLFLWRNSDTVVIGKNQNCFAECKTELLNNGGARLARRLSGGGAVWHDVGNLCFSFISNEAEHDVSRQLSVIAGACRTFDIDARPTGRNDIEAYGKKFSGNAFYKIGKTLCHHGTLLVSGNMQKLGDYLTADKRKLASKGIASIRSRVINLNELCPSLTTDALASAIADTAFEVFGAEPMHGVMPSADTVSERQSFFASDEWLYGANPEFTHEFELSGDQGYATVRVKVKNGIVTECTVYTDSLDVEYAERIRSEYIGKKLKL